LKNTRLIFIISTLLIFTWGCSKPAGEAALTQAVVAKLDGQPITETSFQRAYLPVLLYGDKFDSETTRNEIVNFLIGQRILAGEARAAKLDTNALLRNMHDRFERKAMARQLYQTWVREKIPEPSEAELREGFRRGQKGLLVRHIFAKDEQTIRDYARRLVTGEDNFYTLAQDAFSDTTLSRNGGSLGWITFGDLDETLEDTLYTLKPGQISQPVKSQYGWHILSLDDSREELFITEDDYQKHKDLIRNKIIERRENVVGKKILNDFMDQFKIDFNREITRQVWPIIAKHLHPKTTTGGPSVEFDQMKMDLSTLSTETLLTVNGEPWTVAQILARLPELDRALLYGNLYVAASNVIRDEMLAREAHKLGLDHQVDVLEEVQDNMNQLLSDTYVSQIADTLVFSPSDQEAYYHAHQLDRYHAPDSLLVETFAFEDSARAAKILYQLRNDNLATDPGEQHFWLGPANQTLPLYHLTRSIAKGTMAGPVRYQDHWTLVKLLDRHRNPFSYAKVKDRVVADMERERFNSTRNILLNNLRPQHEITIDYAVLNR